MKSSLNLRVAVNLLKTSKIPSLGSKNLDFTPKNQEKWTFLQKKRKKLPKNLVEPEKVTTFATAYEK